MRTAVRVACAMILAVVSWPATAAAQMPDPRAMSGMWMPTPDLAAGTITVRVVRDQITNNLTGVPVELHGAGEVRRGTTGADGRVQFSGVPAGAQVHAVAIVDGKRLESQPVEVPAEGGLRTILAAEGGGAATGAGAAKSQADSAPAAPPKPSGSVASLSIGGNSRIAAEFTDDVLQMFYLLEITNRSSTPVMPASALIFDLPTGAEGTSLLEGSTKNASAKGTRVTATGPFAPGITPIQIAFRLDSNGGAATIRSTFPLPMDTVSLAIQKIGSMTVTSPQVPELRDRSLEASVFAFGMGPTLAAGLPLIIELDGLPHKSMLPVYVALGLASAIVGAAVWFIVFPGRFQAAGARRRALQERRENGLAVLAALEREHRGGRIDDAQYATRRAALVGQLERIYGELDLEGGTTPGGQGVAA